MCRRLRGKYMNFCLILLNQNNHKTLKIKTPKHYILMFERTG